MSNIQEIWKDIIGYEGLYQISNLGRIKSLPRIRNIRYRPYMTKERILTPTIGNNGYCYIMFQLNSVPKRYLVHRLFAIHFIPNPENKPQINHKNGIKHDNIPTNLEWCTSAENIRHSYVNGLQKPIKGEKSHNSKLKESDVLNIKEMINEGEKQSDIARIYNVTQSHISDIKHNKKWAHLNYQE